MENVNCIKQQIHFLEVFKLSAIFFSIFQLSANILEPNMYLLHNPLGFRLNGLLSWNSPSRRAASTRKRCSTRCYLCLVSILQSFDFLIAWKTAFAYIITHAGTDDL